MLLLGRVVQAAGTAVMMPLLMTTLMTVVPASDRGRVMGNVTMAISVSLAAMSDAQSCPATVTSQRPSISTLTVPR